LHNVPRILKEPDHVVAAILEIHIVASAQKDLLVDAVVQVAKHLLATLLVALFYCVFVFHHCLAAQLSAWGSTY
jgi:hypothetical protein